MSETTADILADIAHHWKSRKYNRLRPSVNHKTYRHANRKAKRVNELAFTNNSIRQPEWEEYMSYEEERVVVIRPGGQPIIKSGRAIKRRARARRSK